MSNKRFPFPLKTIILKVILLVQIGLSLTGDSTVLSFQTLQTMILKLTDQDGHFLLPTICYCFKMAIKA